MNLRQIMNLCIYSSENIKKKKEEKKNSEIR